MRPGIVIHILQMLRLNSNTCKAAAARFLGAGRRRRCRHIMPNGCSPTKRQGLPCIELRARRLGDIRHLWTAGVLQRPCCPSSLSQSALLSPPTAAASTRLLWSASAPLIQQASCTGAWLPARRHAFPAALWPQARPVGSAFSLLQSRYCISSSLVFPSCRQAPRTPSACAGGTSPTTRCRWWLWRSSSPQWLSASPMQPCCRRCTTAPAAAARTRACGNRLCGARSHLPSSTPCSAAPLYGWACEVSRLCLQAASYTHRFVLKLKNRNPCHDFWLLNSSCCITPGRRAV